ncbi:MAG: cytidine deaminase [Candidatus Limnocylindrales bacterium]
MTGEIERLDRTAAASRLAAFPALIDAALRVQHHARAPYSHFAVGAAVLAGSGATFAGCNVESASYGATICAERSALVAAVAAGETSVRAVVVVTPTPEPSTPCGICRQLMAEFGPDVIVLAASSVSDVVLMATLDALLPHSFGASNLDEAAR